MVVEDSTVIGDDPPHLSQTSALPFDIFVIRQVIGIVIITLADLSRLPSPTMARPILIFRNPGYMEDSL